MSEFDDFVSLVERHTGRQGRKQGRETLLLCPAHDDHHPSLHVSEGRDGRPLAQCRSVGCSWQAICEAVGWVPTSSTNGSAEWTPHGDAIAVYAYVDEQSHPLFDVLKTVDKQYPQRRPDPASKSGWRWNLQGVRRVLYRLPEVIAAVERGETIHVPEGEKDVETLRRLGLVATCNPGGAGKWRDEFSALLAGATGVIVIADHDAAGVAHAIAVARSIEHAGGHVEVRQPPVEGHDVSDHLAAGRTLDDLVALTDADMNGAAPPDVEPVIFETLRDFLKRKLPPAESLMGVTRNGTNLLPRYGWVMPWGREGSGKTSIVVDMLFHAAAGIDWLIYGVARPLRIVCVVNEGIPGGLQDKLAQKVETWDGDVDLVLDNLAVYVSPWGEFNFNDDALVQHARSFAVDFGADFVALDPLHTLGTIGAGSPQETEAFKHVLRSFGVWDDLGVITAHHSNKAGMVSGDWARHPDTVIHLEKDGRNAATKLTLDKARPADPHELGVPCLLKWRIDSLSYERLSLETLTQTSNEELLTRVLETLAGASEPLSMRELQGLTTGTNTRLAAVVKEALSTGEIVNVSQKRGSFAFVLAERVDSLDDAVDAVLFDERETGSVEPKKRVVDTDDAPDAPHDPPTGVASASCVAPSLEGRRSTTHDARADEDALIEPDEEPVEDDNPFIS